MTNRLLKTFAKPKTNLGRKLEEISQSSARWAGSSWAFFLAAGGIAIWLITGPFFQFSNTWQLVVNTGTTIITFLMVFLIQRAQNKDALAIQLKLNELVASMKGASNRLIDIENLSEDELQTLHQHFQRLVEMAKNEQNLFESHSVDEADVRHREKSEESHQ